MPAQSKQQQKFMGMVHALKKGDMKPSDASPELKKAAQSMSDKDAKDFASTSHKGLPKKVKQEILELTFLINMENNIQFKGMINKKFDYGIWASQLETYGQYIDNGYGIVKKFKINLALKHFLGLIKICDYIESNFKIALDL